MERPVVLVAKAQPNGDDTAQPPGWAAQALGAIAAFAASAAGLG